MLTSILALVSVIHWVTTHTCASPEGTNKQTNNLKVNPGIVEGLKEGINELLNGRSKWTNERTTEYIASVERTNKQKEQTCKHCLTAYLLAWWLLPHQLFWLGHRPYLGGGSGRRGEGRGAWYYLPIHVNWNLTSKFAEYTPHFYGKPWKDRMTSYLPHSWLKWGPTTKMSNHILD